MPKPLKYLYNKRLIDNLSIEISKHYPAFDANTFGRSVFDKNWKDRELKQRMRHITVCLHQNLPTSYNSAIAILKPAAEEFNGFEYMFFQDYVECYGLNCFESSISALEHFTKYASSEFAVRAFILKNEKRMMKQMLCWARSDNYHVRRLASEGCRPRLPWAISLPAFKHNPQPILPILKTLMNDESEYVRRSVANNLNDISKDNPSVVLDWANQWLNINNQTNALVKHACRSLLKQGDKKALSLFGYNEAKHISVSQFKVPKTVKIDDDLHFSFLLTSQRIRLGKCRIEFAIDFTKANGNLKRKVFKISESNFKKNEKQVMKCFSFKKISTRKYYPGRHQLTIILNGRQLITKPFTLTF